MGGFTPLHYCVLFISTESPNCAQIAKLLLEAGASPTAGDWYTKTPLDYANETGDDALVKLMELYVK